MDSTVLTPVAEQILRDRKVTYLVTDRALNVLSTGGDGNTFFTDAQAELGDGLTCWVPEWLGSEAELRAVVLGEQPRYQLSLVNRQGLDSALHYFTLAALPLRDETGEITGLLNVIEDITEIALPEQRIMQQRNELRLLRDQLTRQNMDLQVANADLLRLSEARALFVSVAAHELRSPLATVQANLELALEEDAGRGNPDLALCLSAIGEGLERLKGIIDNLLDVTRLEASGLELSLDFVDLGELIDAVGREVLPVLNARRQTFAVTRTPGLALGFCDAGRTRQIVRNLLSNAYKYTPHGGRIELALSPGEEGYWEIRVTDSGAGIPLEDQPYLFSRFFRAHSVRQADVPGSGLGLYITRALVELHGGRIWFESRPEHGSTFYVTLPAGELPDDLQPE